MRYASESKNKRWGLPTGLALILIIAVMVTAGAPTPASAATPDQQCGWCHGIFKNSSTTGTETTSRLSGIAAYEDVKTPQADNIAVGIGRGLHGVHMNYSSATYGRSWDSSTHSLSATRGNCSLCHNKDQHESGYVNFSGMSYTNTSSDLKISSRVQIFNGTTGYTPYGLDITAINGKASCTEACHKGTSSANMAPWGNYTSASIKLNCNSCHGAFPDITSVTFSGTLSGNHNNHLMSNCTTPNYSGAIPPLMSSAGNAGCVNCHPDNRNDQWKNGKADDGSVKAYPHAKDGTNVVSDNATLQEQISSPVQNGVNTTCTSACHPRLKNLPWNGTVNCDMCHYYAAIPLDTNNTGINALSSGHNWHFKSGYQFACVNCHPDHSSYSGAAQLDSGHARSLPPQGYNANILLSLGWDYSTQTCSSTPTTCHGSATTPAWTTKTNSGCATCHEYPGATVGFKDWTGTNNGHTVRYAPPATDTHMTATSYFNYTSDTFSAVTQDTSKCGLCHRNIKSHRNAFAHLSSASGFTYYTTSSTYYFTYNINGSSIGRGGVGQGKTDNATCSNVYCHSGSTTPVWW